MACDMQTYLSQTIRLWSPIHLQGTKKCEDGALYSSITSTVAESTASNLDLVSLTFRNIVRLNLCRLQAKPRLISALS